MAPQMLDAWMLTREERRKRGKERYRGRKREGGRKIA